MGFEVNWFKSINCITDQGVNIVKAFEPFKRFNGSAHMLNAVLRNISLLSKTVKQDIDTRWNSKYFRLRSSCGNFSDESSNEETQLLMLNPTMM